MLPVGLKIKKKDLHNKVGGKDCVKIGKGGCTDKQRKRVPQQKAYSISCAVEL